MNYPATQHTAPPAPVGPSRVGQGTAVEQSRAAAEVQAAVVVAQQCPRNIQSAVAEMEQACGRLALAEKAFYSYRRGGSAVTGPSVFLARELARIWGNLQHGLIEMRRDDEYGQSEMQAFAWDVEKNSRVSNTFIVPHKRDKKGGATALTELRDIYENNANNGARRVRQAIFSVLPGWFTDQAIDICRATLTNGGGEPLPQRISKALKAFDSLGVTVDRIEAKYGRPTGEWTEHDVTDLGILYGSIRRGELTVDDAFPEPRVTSEELTAPPADGGGEAWPETAQPPQ